MTADALQPLRDRLEYARGRKSAAVHAWSAADAAGHHAEARNASQRMRYWDARVQHAFEALHPVLLTPVDSLPWLEGWETRADAAERYTRTPQWLPRRGMSVHVGGGVFVTVCGHCDHAVRHPGTVPIYGTVGPHEVAEHGAMVAGINLALLP